MVGFITEAPAAYVVVVMAVLIVVRYSFYFASTLNALDARVEDGWIGWKVKSSCIVWKDK